MNDELNGELNGELGGELNGGMNCGWNDENNADGNAAQDFGMNTDSSENRGRTNRHHVKDGAIDKKAGSDRKKEILEAAKIVFVKKGFSKTTMEDVIAQTSLSKGGVYYHYKSTKEMIFDMFMEGNEYRINIMRQYIRDNRLSQEDLMNEEIVAEMMTQKILTVSPMMEVYAQFLIEAAYNAELQATYSEIVRKSFEEIAKIFPHNPAVDPEKMRAGTDFMINLMNIFILGSNILKVHDNFENNRILIKEMIQLAIRYFRP